MFSFIKKVYREKWVLRSLFYTVYFNFKMLPIKQACKLPILLYKPKFLSCNGKISILGNVAFGMIRLGRYRVPFYPNNGIRINLDGNIVFCGKCDIGNDSVISVGKLGELTLGNRFSATAALKLSCNYRISFKDNVTIGWDNIIMDSDFHRMTKSDMTGYTRGVGEILIGSNNWFACRNIILKNTKTPNYCTISATSVLNRDYSEFGEYSVIGNKNEMSLLRGGVWLDILDPNSSIIEIHDG